MVRISCTFLTLAIFLMQAGVVYSAPDFKKVAPKSGPELLTEGVQNQVRLDSNLQDFSKKSPSRMRYSVGGSLQGVPLGIAARAEFLRRFNPLYLTLGTGYQAETIRDDEGEARNLHEIPGWANLGYSPKLWGRLHGSLEAGPAYRWILQRGFTPQQSEDFAYPDFQSAMGLSMSWTRSSTNADREVGIRWSRLWGIADRPTAAQRDFVFASLTWDL